MKKIKKISLGISSALVSTIPAAIVVACGDTTPADSPDTQNKIYENDTKTVGDLIDQFDNDANTSVATNLLNEVRNLVAETLYEEEFEASKQLQKEYFNYELIDLVDRQWELAKSILAENEQSTTAQTKAEKETEVDQSLEIANLSENSENTLMQNRKKSIEGLQSDYDDVQTKIDEIQADQDGGKKLDFNSALFASRFPRIITPLDKIKETQNQIFNEKRDGFIDAYSTASEGEAAWVEQRSSLYQGAASDEEAINVLVNNAISNVAFSRFNYSINTSFTVKQVKSGAFSMFGDPETFTFETTGVFTKDPEDDNGKVYFLARSTRDVSQILINVNNLSEELNQDALTSFAEKQIISVQHGLVDIKAPDGDTLPWVVTKDTIKKLLSYYGNQETGGVLKVFDSFKNLFQNSDINDDAFLRYFSNNEDATKTKYGNLGVNPLSQWVQTMVPGFGLGIVAARSQYLEQSNPPVAAQVGYGGEQLGKQILDGIQTKLEQTLSSIGLDQMTRASDKNNAIAQYIDNLSEDEFNKKYGAIFRDPFQENKQLVYELNKEKKVYLVISSFGLHIIKITEYANLNTLQAELINDLKKIAEEDDTSAGSIDWASMLGQIYNNQTIVKDLIDNQELMEKVKLSSAAAFKAEDPERYQKWVDNDYLKEGDDILDAVRKRIENIEYNSIITAATSALKDKQQFIIDQMDKRFLTETIVPNVIYNVALEQMGATK